MNKTQILTWHNRLISVIAIVFTLWLLSTTMTGPVKTTTETTWIITGLMILPYIVYLLLSTNLAVLKSKRVRFTVPALFYAQVCVVWLVEGPLSNVETFTDVFAPLVGGGLMSLAGVLVLLPKVRKKQFASGKTL